MRASAILAAALIALAVSACSRGEHEGDFRADGLEAIAFTHFTDKTELFVEFEPLRVNADSTFAAHLTRLSDFKPVTEGRLVVTLSGGGNPDERFEATAPAAPGIFKPVVRPKHSGPRTLSLTLDAPGLQISHELGAVAVYANEKAAAQATKGTEAEGGAIRFLKEQQWQVDFATEQAGVKPLRATVVATGVIRAPSGGSANVMASVAGQVMTMGSTFPHVGLQVTKGQVLFTIAPRLAGNVDLATLRLDSDKARLRLELAQKERARLERLFEMEAVPERRLIAARNEERVARAELEAAQKRLSPYATGGASGAGVLVRAPVSGTITDIAVAPGAFVNEGQALVQVAETAKLWLEARIAEADTARIQNPQGAWLRTPGSDQPLAVEIGRNGRLIAFGKALDMVTRTVPLILEFDNARPDLRIGTAARVEVWSDRSTQAVAVPVSAIVEEAGQNVLFVQRGGETFERRVVKLGIRDGSLVEIREGLEEGERVVVRGAYLVRLAGTSPKRVGEGHAH